MYEDKDPWPFKCPTCGKEFAEKIGRFKAAGYTVYCPSLTCQPGQRVGTRIISNHEEFSRMLAETQKGSFDPWQGMLRISKKP